jgi:hypothetical protein
MLGRLGSFALLAAVLVSVLGCGDGRIRCYAVKGELYVDGKPAKDCFMYLHPADADAGPGPVHPFGQTEEDGTFAVSSYDAGDGAPAGEYIVTFKWPKPSGLLKNRFDGPDQLNNKYSDQKMSKYRITVEKKENVLPRYELTTSK